MTLRRPLLAAAFAMGAGVWLGATHFAGVAVIAWACAIAAALVAAGSFLPKKARAALFLCAVAVLGFTAGSVRAEIKPQTLPSPTTLCGVVSAPSQPAKSGNGAWIQLRSAFADGSPVSGRVNVWVENTPNVQVGDIVSLGFRPFDATPALNPGGYNAALNLWRDGVSFSGRGIDIETVGKAPLTLRELAYAPRQTVEKAMQKAMPGWEGGVAVNMLLGGLDHVPDDIARDFSETGVVHILSVSGLHVGVIVGALTWLLIRLNVTRRKVASVCIPLVWLYAWFTGLSPSAMRAAIMTTAALGGSAVGRDSDPLSGLSAAFIIILIAQPMQLFKMGFQLSFGSVAGILLLYPRISAAMRKTALPALLTDIFSVGIAAQIGIAPFLLKWMGVIPLVSIIAGVPIVLVAGWALIVGMLLAVFAAAGAVPIAAVFAWLETGLVRFIAATAKLFASLPLGEIRMAAPSALAIGLCFALVSTFAMHVYIGVNKRLRAVAAVALSAMLVFSVCWSNWQNRPQGLEISMVAVGQGDATLLRTPDGVVALVDVGLPTSALTRTLRHRGLNVDAVFISHGDRDHAGGIIELLQGVPVGGIWLPAGLTRENMCQELISGLSLAKGMGVPIYELMAGDRLAIGEHVTANVLWPDSARQFSDNDMSMVMEVTYAGRTALFTGDIGAKTAWRLNFSPADILKVSHHGGGDGTNAEFLERAKPKVALIGVGAGNNYGHPKPEVVWLLQEYGAQVLRTDTGGMITAQILPNGEIRTRAYLQEAQNDVP